jgi:hypothetical protein
MQGDASRMTQAQLASVCKWISSWLREVIADAWTGNGSSLIKDLSPLSSLSRLTALNLKYHREIKDLTPLCTLICLRELQLWGCHSILSLAPLRSLTQITSLDVSGIPVTTLEPLASLVLLTELNLGCYFLPSSRRRSSAASLSWRT